MTSPEPESVKESGADLVVGGTGRVGRMLARAWGTDGPVFQQRRPGAGLHWDPGAGPAAFLDWCVEAGGCRTMVVLAGVTPGPGADLAANPAIAGTCLAAAREAGVARVLYASSSAVYGPGRGQPLTETDAPSPVNAYGTAKVEAEAICARYRADGLPVTVLRIGNVAGADQLLINAGRAAEDAPLRLDRFADGAGPRRSYIGAGTLARVIGALCSAEDLPDVLNVGAPEPVAMEALMSAAGVPWVWVPAPETALQDLVLDCGALSRLVDFGAEDSDPGELVAQWRRYGGTA